MSLHQEHRFKLTRCERQAAKFNTLTAEAQRAIDPQQKRRTALISAAVSSSAD